MSAEATTKAVLSVRGGVRGEPSRQAFRPTTIIAALLATALYFVTASEKL